MSKLFDRTQVMAEVTTFITTQSQQDNHLTKICSSAILYSVQDKNAVMLNEILYLVETQLPKYSSIIRSWIECMSPFMPRKKVGLKDGREISNGFKWSEEKYNTYFAGQTADFIAGHCLGENIGKYKRANAPVKKEKAPLTQDKLDKQLEKLLAEAQASNLIINIPTDTELAPVPQAEASIDNFIDMIDMLDKQATTLGVDNSVHEMLTAIKDLMLA